VPTVTSVRTGYPNEVAANLIGMCTHGRTGLQRYLVGGVTERVVRTAPVPVLTVRIPEQDDEDES